MGNSQVGVNVLATKSKVDNMQSSWVFNILTLTLSVYKVNSETTVCMGAPATKCYIKDGRECIFPFYYYTDADDVDANVEFNDCTKTNSFHSWCVVETERDLIDPAGRGKLKEWDSFEAKTNKWGYCYGPIEPPDQLEFITPATPNCRDYVLTTTGETCQFSFTYHGVTNNFCTLQDASTHAGPNKWWCATASD